VAVEKEILSQRPHDIDTCRGGEYHWLHVQIRPPDDEPVRFETFRGKRELRHCIYTEENSVSIWK
jgi:hypothetical protein